MLNLTSNFSDSLNPYRSFFFLCSNYKSFKVDFGSEFKLLSVKGFDVTISFIAIFNSSICDFNTGKSFF